MMLLKSAVATTFAAMLACATPLAAEIIIKDAYARSAIPSSPAGAAFMVVMNDTGRDDVLISVSSDVAKRIELHTHAADANGVMKMGPIEGGIAIPAGEMHALARGGDHVMLMGLTRKLEQGDEITLTLTFEHAGEVEVTLPVDRERKPDHGSGHGAHGTSD